MKTIYRIIQCSDRLPEKSGEYLTDVGKITYHDELGEFGYNSEDLFGIEDRYWQYVKCDYWLEEIQLPTNEEKENFLNRVRNNYSINEVAGAEMMYKWLLSKLK